MEQMRLEALRSYRILDTDAHPSFDAVTRAASLAFCAPIALISLVDADRQWFKSSLGLGLCETPKAISFCAHAVEACQPLVVEDASTHPTFKSNPLVTGAPHIRFYAGVPIIDHEGFALGTMCVIDIEPRVVSETHMALLAALAQIAMTAITAHHQGWLLRRTARKIATCPACEMDPI